MNPTYSDWVALGALAGLLIMLVRRAHSAEDAARLLFACVVIGALGLGFGRLGYGLLNLEVLQRARR